MDKFSSPSKLVVMDAASTNPRTSEEESGVAVSGSLTTKILPMGLTVALSSGPAKPFNYEEGCLVEVIMLVEGEVHGFKAVVMVVDSHVVGGGDG